MNAEFPELPAWQAQSERTLAETRIFKLQGVTYRHPRREVEREFVVIRAPSWVNVLALTPDGQIVLVRQFRYGTNEFSLEIPGGVVETGEDPVVAGVRETAEETGYEGGPAQLLGVIQPNPAIQDNRCHLVFVPDARLTRPQNLDPDEEMSVHLMPVAEVMAAARSGRIAHSLVMNALFLFEPIWAELVASGKFKATI